ncbi:MAG TPA: hypothetical protein VMK65_03125 [Longimicrobiales bacterium]|nr:hypothetical protein [Longimicrobiales bacterium]
MHIVVAVALLALATPAWAQPAPPDLAAAQETAHVRVTARIVVVDRDAFTRAGLTYAVLGSDRVRVGSTGRGARGGRVAVGTHGVTAFLDALRLSRWLRSESTQQVLTRSGAAALVSSSDLTMGRRAARTRGPSLAVLPTVLADGRVHLRVSAREEDTVSYGWGYGVDGSPAAVDTEIIARAGEEILLASSSAVRSTREAGLLRWGSAEQGRDVLVAVTVTVVSPSR